MAARKQLIENGIALTLDHLVALVGHLAWPVVVVFVLYWVRNEIRQIVASLARRIGDPTSDLSIGRTGLEIKTRVGEPDDISNRLAEYIRRDPEFEANLRRWIEEKGLNVSVTSFIYGGVYESLRRAATDELLT